MHNRKANRMKNWKDLTHYVGFDWAKDHHAVVIVNAEGHIVADFEFAHSLEGWKSFAETRRRHEPCLRVEVLGPKTAQNPLPHAQKQNTLRR